MNANGFVFIIFAAQVDPWRLMMSLKSGLLAESTWALDVISILLYDDHSILYFHLSHLPGLMDTLLDHLRRCLLEIFGEELMDDVFVDTIKQNKIKAEKRKSISDISFENPIESDEEDIGATAAFTPPKKDSLEREGNYTLISRQGLAVKFEDESEDTEVMFDRKNWDWYTGFKSLEQELKLGKGDLTNHIITHFENHDSLKLFKDKFFGKHQNHIKTKKQKVDELVLKQEVKTQCDEEDNENTEETTKSDNSSMHKEQSSDEHEKMDASDSSEAPKMNGEVDSSCSDKDTMETTKVISTSKVVSLAKDMDAHIKMEKDDSSSQSLCIGRASDCTDNCLSSLPIKQELSDPDFSSTGKDLVKNSTKDPTNDSPSTCTKQESIKKEESESSDSVTETVKDEVSNSPAGNNASDKHTLFLEYLELKSNDIGFRSIKDLKRKWEVSEEESEAYQPDQPPVYMISFSKEELSRRCICISNIFRSLSFLPGNEREMSKHQGLLRILGKLLLLHHKHPKRKQQQKRFDRDDAGMHAEETVIDFNQEEWWWDTLDALRENTLVVVANMAGHLHLNKMSGELCFPLLDGLLHWAVCPSACALDPMPTMSANSVLSAQRLSLETLCKLCVTEGNVDLLVATPPFSRLVQLITNLVNLLADRKEQVMREFAIVLLSSLVAGDSSVARAVALQHPAISLLLDFIETAEHQAMQIANSHGVDMLRENPEMMGTSLDMLRRAAKMLRYMSQVPANQSLFLKQQDRLLTLVMSQVLDQQIASLLADIMYHCSHEPSSSLS